MTLNDVVQIIENVAVARGVRFDFEAREQMPNLSTNSTAFPICQAVLTTNDISQDVDIYQFDLYFLDKIARDRSNWQSIISAMNDKARAVILDINNTSLFGVSFTFTGGIDPINNWDLDNTAGVLLRLNVTAISENSCGNLPTWNEVEIDVNGDDYGTFSAPATVDIVVKYDDDTIVPTTIVGNEVFVQVTPIDTDAQAFITATGITDDNQKSAINDLVVGLKMASLWTKFYAIYPMVGGTAATHKYNLKNTLDTDAAFRLSFFGGWTHSATGAKPNGVNAYADTHLSPYVAVASIDDYSFSVYLRDNTDGAMIDIGVASGSHNAIYCKYGGITYQSFGGSSYNNYGTTDSRGLFVANRNTALTSKGYYGITKKLDTTDYNGYRGLATGNMFLGARNGGAAPLFSNREIAFSFIGKGFTDLEITQIYSLIQLFQTKLNRAV